MMEEENVIRPHQEIQALTIEEKKFLLAVERGDVAGTRSVDTKDALLHAISEEFVDAVEMLLDHEDRNHSKEGHHSWESLPLETATFTSDISPLILAAHRDNYEIIKILLDRGSTLPMPHDVRCGCDECVISRLDDSLRYSRSRINAYRALASPSLIALSSKDPILTAFELSWELRRLSFLEHEFKDATPTSTTLIPISSTIHSNQANENSTDDTTTEKSTTTTKDPQLLLFPPAEVNASIAQMHNAPRKKGQIIISSEPDCPSLHDADSLSQTQLVKRLTHGCRYDRLERPITFGVNGTRQPITIWTRAYIYFMQNLEAHDLQFKLHALLQFRYVDPRLVFKEVSPKRKEPIMGEVSLRDALWVPHIFLANERSSSILGTAEKDVLTSISPDGTVIISTRIQASLHCWMNLQKFPFDEQTCHIIFESWMYNTSELILHWENKSPVTFAPELHLTEYVLLNMWKNETTINADLSDLRHGAFAGNYSSLSFTVHLNRQMSFYLLDYFLPSMMIVAISWVSFWLQADQAAPRIMLGTSTMLTFITLASSQGKTLLKVSYIKVSEVWFLGCTGFIFGSLVEFAFVNTIWRRKKNVELKKVNSKYILKSTLTPRPSRKDMSSGLQKSRSCSSLDGSQNGQNSFNNYLTVHSFPSKNNIPTITTTKSLDDLITENGSVAVNMEPSSSSATLQVHGQEECYTPEPTNGKSGWTTMTPQEISMWIDRRSRFLFPCAFVVFNAIFWTFVYCL